jgi:hypothetical protein
MDRRCRKFSEPAPLAKPFQKDVDIVLGEPRDPGRLRRRDLRKLLIGD